MRSLTLFVHISYCLTYLDLIFSLHSIENIQNVVFIYFAGEYVSLYQQQRSILRQRTAEKDGYIYQLAHERIEMQQKLGELQALVMQLLNERNLLHSFNGNIPTSEPGSTHTAKNHPHKHHAKRANVSSEERPGDGTTEGRLK